MQQPQINLLLFVAKPSKEIKAHLQSQIKTGLSLVTQMSSEVAMTWEFVMATCIGSSCMYLELRVTNLT